MSVISWKIDGIFNADAKKVYEEIKDTKLTPQEVLEKAKDEDSELHKCFEWDDSIAAEKYRYGQARKVIQLLVIRNEDVDKKDDEPVRVFQVTSERNTYSPVKLIVQQPDEYQNLLNRAIRELEAFKKRYKSLSELEDVFDAIDALI